MLQKTTQCCNLLNIKSQPSVIRRDIVYLWLSPNVVCCRFEVYNKNNKEKITSKRTKISPKETHTGHDKIHQKKHTRGIPQISTLCVCLYSKEWGNRRSASLVECVRFQAGKNIPVPPYTHNRSVFSDNQPRSNLEGRLKRRRTNKRKIVSLVHSITPSVRRNFLHISVKFRSYSKVRFLQLFLRRRPRWFYDDRKY